MVNSKRVEDDDDDAPSRRVCVKVQMGAKTHTTTSLAVFT
jgi:hypothetical protein